MKYSQFLLIVWATIQMLPTNAQWRIAQLDEDGKVLTNVISEPEKMSQMSARTSLEIRLRDGYPLVFAADPTFKNFRNVTLADLDGDGADEIIFGVANRFFVYRNETLWWSRELSGLARFPSAVGDLENDGIQDIVVLTGFNGEAGQVYAFNSRGVDKPGWPKSFDGRWMISSPALADVDNNGQLEIICSDLENSLGSVYLLKADGSTFSPDWPVTLPNVPAVTPSVGDIDRDGMPDIVVNSTREIYAFDLQGNVKQDWPFGNGLTKFSFQSPVLADLEGDGFFEIITEGHGDLPLFMILDATGHHLDGWPRPVPQGQWTFHTPTVINYQNQPLILTGRPISDNLVKPMLFAWRPDGSLLDGFPIEKSGGLEGIITVADLDEDDEPEIMFPSNMIDSSGYGFIHAYNLDGSGEVPGFPLRPYGWTFLNGATLGDVDGNGLLDLAVLTYTQNEASAHDSALLFVYETNSAADSDHILWGTYKGNNQRNGLIEDLLMTSIRDDQIPEVSLYPNPVKSFLTIESNDPIDHVQIFNIQGGEIMKLHPNQQREDLDLELLPEGIYVLKIKSRNNFFVTKFLKN